MTQKPPDTLFPVISGAFLGFIGGALLLVLFLIYDYFLYVFTDIVTPLLPAIFDSPVIAFFLLIAVWSSACAGALLGGVLAFSYGIILFAITQFIPAFLNKRSTPVILFLFACLSASATFTILQAVFPVRQGVWQMIFLDPIPLLGAILAFSFTAYGFTARSLIEI